MCVFISVLCCVECSDFSPPVAVMLLIFLCLEALLFLTFTAVMFGTQIHSICNDETVGAACYYKIKLHFVIHILI